MGGTCCSFSYFRFSGIGFKVKGLGFRFSFSDYTYFSKIICKYFILYFFIRRREYILTKREKYDPLNISYFEIYYSSKEGEGMGGEQKDSEMSKIRGQDMTSITSLSLVHGE